MLDRLKHCKNLNKIVICTSTNSQDDPLESIAAKENVYCYRGSEDDVLLRLFKAAIIHRLPFFANITADCPLTDPVLVDQAIMEFIKTGPDLAMYGINNGYLPFNCYVLRTSALESVINNKQLTDTEIWLKYFLTDRKMKIKTIDPGKIYHHNELKTSIDYPEDYKFMKRIFSELYEQKNIFSLLDIIKLVKEKPKILEINSTSNLLKRWRDHQRSVS